MMWLKILFSLFIIEQCGSISSPISPLSNFSHSTELDANIADLWWTIDEAKGEILFELHINTTGWIALGISPAGGMEGADIGVGWIDNNGSLHFQDRYARTQGRPVIDNTTQDWFPIKGQEINGWTAIQFKRLLDTCDPMDYPVKGGTNILIYAYGLVDPVNNEITYHDIRRGTRIIPLRSYAQPPIETKFAGLQYFDLQLNNYVVPSTDTTYHCKVYKAPTNYTDKRHAIAYKVLVDSNNVDLVHHLLLHECDPTHVFDDANLPDGVCDEINDEITPCSANIATGWAVGGDHIVEFAEEAGYPVGSNSPNKYFMIQMHYDNPRKTPNRRDSSGIRFYLGDQLRQHDLGYLTFGTQSFLLGIAIPPKMDKFIIDSYCPSESTQNIPQSGITVFAAFPHTHLQGISMWTKIIRNQTAVEYLFNAEAYQFNYQFENRLQKRIQLYPGDEFATRCIYNTMNKNEPTIGGEKTQNEMCLHFFTYYPRMDKFSACYTQNTDQSFQNQINSSAQFNYTQAMQWFMDRTWTPQLAQEWQQYYNGAPRYNFYVTENKFQFVNLGALPKYKDFDEVQCEKQTTLTTSTGVPTTSAGTLTNSTGIPTNSTGVPTSSTTKRNNAMVIHQNSFLILLFFIILIIT